jgi:hypothetical protein
MKYATASRRRGNTFKVEGRRGGGGVSKHDVCAGQCGDRRQAYHERGHAHALYVLGVSLGKV